MYKEGHVIRGIFLDHPRRVNETYAEHGRFALGVAGKLLLAAGAAVVHALIPALFEKTASRLVAELYQKTNNRGA
jgi:hypothetical protein